MAVSRHPQNVLALVCLICALPAWGYDTLRLTLQRADSLFLKENLQLLAQAYAIGAKDALIIQSKAYPNPLFSMSLNAVDPQNDKYFNIGPNGQKEFEIEQLFLLGGKRKTSIAIARQNKTLAEIELSELLRNLRLSLHSSLYLLGKHKAVLDSYRKQLVVLDQLIGSYEEQSRRGNLPVKDVIRLKSVRLSISNNQLEEVNGYLEEVKRIQTLLHTPNHPVPMIDDGVFVTFQQPHTVEELMDIALEHRPDYELARQESTLAASVLKLQKQMAIPDVAVNTGYDQRGGAFLNQVQVGVSIPLPLWNRNKGNIRAAAYDQQAAELYIEQKRAEIQAEVTGAAEQMRTGIDEYVRANQIFTSDFDEVFRGMNENFARRNISILEFVDFFEAYNESLADYQKIRTQLALQAEQINYVTAYTIY